MKQRWLGMVVVLYAVNLILLLIAPWYGSFWAATGTAFVGNSEYPWMWATVGECIRCVGIAGLAWFIAWQWPESDPDSTSDDILSIGTILGSFNVAHWFQPRAYRDTLEALNGMEGSDRLRMLEARAKTLPNGLSTRQVQRLIGPLEDYDKVRALDVLAKKLAPNARRTPLLECLTGSERNMADEILHRYNSTRLN